MDIVFNQGLPIKVSNEYDIIGQDDMSGLPRDALGLNTPFVSELASEHHDEQATDETIEEPSADVKFNIDFACCFYPEIPIVEFVVAAAVVCRAWCCRIFSWLLMLPGDCCHQYCRVLRLLCRDCSC